MPARIEEATFLIPEVLFAGRNNALVVTINLRLPAPPADIGAGHLVKIRLHIIL